tara:strand:- start:37 stop:1182 length:1146 start_codon:yes stop_codon:yes gene_type:complete
MKKNRILRIIHTLDPALGGPSNVIWDHSKMLVKYGYFVDILTSDKINKLKSKNKNKKIKIINRGPSLNKYGINIKLILWLFNNKNKYDYFIIHELWRIYTLLARILLNNYVVFIHGQLDPFFKKNLLKKIKKQIYWFFIERKNLIKSNSILLTSENEKKLLNNTYVNTSGIKKKVVKYGLYKRKLEKNKISKAFYEKFKSLKNKKFYLFLGRFHEKKGCEIIIDTIYQLKKDFKDFVLMAGPLNGTIYEKKIFSLIKKYELENKIIISDILTGDTKWGAINQSKAMILPSHGENFGVSLIESLSLSKPVITTKKVNIYKEILKYKAGLVSNDTTNSFKKIFSEFDNYNPKKLNKMSINAKKCFDNKFNLNLNTKKIALKFF